MAKTAKVSATPETTGLIVAISGLLPSLSPAEQRVARLVVADPAGAARRTITDLATAAETSEATVVIVAQRVSTIRDADRIVVLDEGQVVGTGSHHELMESNETYREIVLSQLTEAEAA